MPDTCFKFDWYAGASAQIEVFSPEIAESGGISSSRGPYQFKYTPPFHSTIRPPVEESKLTPTALTKINDRLDKLVTAVDARTSAGPGLPRALPDNLLMEEMEMLGQQLHDLIIPPYVQADLLAGGLFLEIGMDDKLLDYPWELMHDGSNFLCLKHAMGRFVNGTAMIPPTQRPVSQLGTSIDILSILLISVPNPPPRIDENKTQVEYPELPEAAAETEAICDVLAPMLSQTINLEVLKDRDATYDNVYKALKRRGPYQIVHFNGHATFDEKNPHDSALVLYDGNMATGEVQTYLARKPPILCFINACETAKISVSKGWKDRYDIFGLARAFLETGAYLLGSRWKVSDRGAAGFAKKFYMSLLKEGEPLGKAILEARKACKEESPLDELAWANYTLYGDPRVCFRKIAGHPPPVTQNIKTSLKD